MYSYILTVKKNLPIKRCYFYYLNLKKKNLISNLTDKDFQQNKKKKMCDEIIQSLIFEFQYADETCKNIYIFFVL
jgi:hypothetical protein